MKPVHNIVGESQLANSNVDMDSLDRLFVKYYPRLIYFADSIIKNKPAAEDIVCNAFIKTWQSEALLESETHFTNYLYRVIRNDCIKHQQKQRRDLNASADIKYLYGNDTQSNIFDTMVRAELLGRLYEGMKQLAPQCRQVAEMMFVEGKTTSEIAEAMELSTSTVKTQKARAIKTLKKIVAVII